MDNTTHWKAYIEGDNNSLDTLFRLLHSEMLFTAFHYLRDEEKAKDIVSDIFLKSLQIPPCDREKLLGAACIDKKTLLRVIVKNKCLDTLKVEKSRGKILFSIFSGISRSYSKTNFLEDDAEFIFGFLTNRQREVLNLHLKGFDNQEIASQLNISYNTCRNTIYDSKQKLRQIWNVFMT